MTAYLAATGVILAVADVAAYLIWRQARTIAALTRRCRHQRATIRRLRADLTTVSAELARGWAARDRQARQLPTDAERLIAGAEHLLRVHADLPIIPDPRTSPEEGDQ